MHYPSNVADFFKNKKNVKALKQLAVEKANMEDLIVALETAVRHETKGVKKAAVLFSGGLDSGLMARLIGTHVKKTVLFSAGTPGSHVQNHAEPAAWALGLPLKFHRIDVKEIQKKLPFIQRIIRTKNPMHTQIALAEYFAMNAAHESGFKTVYCGQGADELFAGYNEFRNVFKEKGEKGVTELCWKKLEHLWEENLQRDLSIAQATHVDLRAPYLNKVFLLTAMQIPVHDKIQSEHDEQRKHALRKLALWYGVPELIALQRKKAIQYDSGINKAVKNVVKK